MRLVSWNCKGAFHSKSTWAEELRPDLLIVPECEIINAITQSFDSKPLRASHWVGNMPNKGLGVFAFGEYSLAVHPDYDAEHRWILPLKVSGPSSFTLLAVWTVPANTTKGSYVQPLREALVIYAKILAEENVIWAGDFNANFLFDEPSRLHKFSAFVAELAALNIHSVYHRGHNCAHGEEVEKTFYMYHHAEKGHHIDYVFAGPFVQNVPHKLSIGTHAAWSKLSDHVPLILDVNLES